jgi:shikimate dehydrogenase
MSKPDRYAVFGQPVSHSLSPRIHWLFAQQSAQELTYEAIEVAPAQFAGAVADFFAGGGRGLNITVPHKLSAFALATRTSDRARRAGAVNTLSIEPQGRVLFGDNTDGVGLVRDLTGNLALPVSGQRVLILGAGGATRGILAPLLELKPAALCIANRSPERARALAALFADLAPVQAASPAELAGTRWDLILNATSASLSGELPELSAELLDPACLCYDLAYGHGATPFVRWARAHGAVRSVSGLGMLIEQAAEAFYHWRGVRPDTAPVRALLKLETGDS